MKIMILKYRPEIDGLRCIAVLLVILHHLSVPGFSGGFVGVDVFFVISGYLITAIILAELKKGQFTFGSFYKRRAIRLAPAYFTVLLVTSVFAYLLMLPAELENFSNSALYSTFFAANFYMWDAVGGYFGSGADTTPLLHLWSLAVEEQFYVIWPVTLMLLWRWVPRYLLALIVIALFAGIFISEYGAINYRAAAYYLMPTRAFELLIGAVLACVPLAYFERVPAFGRLLLSLLGMVLIFYGNVFFTAETWFPGVNALFPCVGTFLLIAFVRNRDSVFGRLLSSRIAVNIGKVSYPAYLWHWPIIAFLNLQLIDITPLVSIAVIFATLLLATLTYHYVEKPARKFRDMQWSKVVLGGFVLPATLFSTAAIAVMQANGMPDRFDDILNKKSAAVLSYADDRRGRCNEGSVKSPLGEDECVLGVSKAGVDILLVGDSHANHFSGMVDVMAKNAGLRGYDVTQSNSPFLVDVERFYKQDNSMVYHENFQIRNSVIKNQLLPNEYKFVVLGGAFKNHFNGGFFSDDKDTPPKVSDHIAFKSAFFKTIDTILENGSIPVIIKGNPTFERDISHCTLNNLRFDLSEDCNLSFSFYKNEISDWSEFVDQLVIRYDKLIVIDPAKTLCNEKICYSDLKDIPLYKDSGHLNYIGSELIGELYIKEFDNPFVIKSDKSDGA
jgi:peptidoglycan/LPS O-acetylase OafA/YrhL